MMLTGHNAEIGGRMTLMTMVKIGERLRLTRACYGLTQGEFAEGAGIARHTYNQYENGKKRPSLETATALCDAYGLTLDWIFHGRVEGLPHQLARIFPIRRRQR